MVRSRMVRVLVAVGVMVAVAGGAGRATAADAPPALYPVEVGGDASVRSIEVTGPGGPFDCGYRCSLELGPGRYRLVVTDMEGYKSFEWLSVHGPRHVAVAPGTTTRSSPAGSCTGWVVAGIAAAVTGRALKVGRGSAALSDVLVPAPASSAASQPRLAPAAGLRWTGLALSGSF